MIFSCNFRNRTTGNELLLEVWRRSSEDSSGRSSNGNPEPSYFHTERSSPVQIDNGNHGEGAVPYSTPPPVYYPPPPSTNHCCPPPKVIQLPPVSILKPPPPAPPPHAQVPTLVLPPPPPTTSASSWKIRFNIEVGHGTYV